MDLTKKTLAELKDICIELDIPSTGNKGELIKRIEQYHSGTLVKEVVYTTIPGRGHLVGIHINDRKSMDSMIKIIGKADAKFDHYASDYYFYKTNEKIKLL